ncbi:hypothetical protein GA0116948_104124 [Chitinophaga costaii]|uniref:Uncharacterized protein n=1 Tax=Chitinophaga costaii TaxID=1335309 RepID=A0A1C4CHF5_9BACT|nr:hypothetical protein GA0116948_104124 [Chitinophaga costaii]
MKFGLLFKLACLLIAAMVLCVHLANQYLRRLQLRKAPVRKY